MSGNLNIVLTGSSSGIGRALAERLLASGHRVWGLARSEQGEFVAKHTSAFEASRCDVADWSQVETAATAVAARWPHVDGLITCAGRQGEIATALTANPANWTATVRTNLDGTFHAIRAFAPLLLRAPRRAKIICFSGGGSTKARPRFSAYGAAKTAIVRLVETIAAEEGGRLDINAVAPGAIHTRMTDELLARGPAVVGAEEFAAAQKAAGGAPPDKALGLVEWLLSSASDGVTGRLLAAPWDPWPTLGRYADVLATSDIYMLRRILPEDRSKKW